MSLQLIPPAPRDTTKLAAADHVCNTFVTLPRLTPAASDNNTPRPTRVKDGRPRAGS